MEAIADRIEADLRTLGTEERAVHEKAYLKSDLEHIGVPVPAIRRLTVAAVKDLDRGQTLTLVDELWQAPVHELRMAAIETLIRNVGELERDDLRVAERLIDDSRTWAYVDALAIKVVGHLVHD